MGPVPIRSGSAESLFDNRDRVLRSPVALEFIVENELVEILYDLYSPIISESQVLQLQERLMTFSDVSAVRDKTHTASTRGSMAEPCASHGMEVI